MIDLKYHQMAYLITIQQHLSSTKIKIQCEPLLISIPDVPENRAIPRVSSTEIVPIAQYLKQ